MTALCASALSMTCSFRMQLPNVPAGRFCFPCDQAPSDPGLWRACAEPRIASLLSPGETKRAPLVGRGSKLHSSHRMEVSPPPPAPTEAEANADAHASVRISVGGRRDNRRSRPDIHSRLERTMAGLARARANGSRLGRPRIASDLQARVETSLRQGIGIQRTARQVGVGVGTVQRIRQALLGCK
jgi:hypothetical protein